MTAGPSTTRRRLLGLLAAGSALPLAGCDAFSIVNGLSPSDTYSLTGGIAYGSGPRQQLDIYKPVKASSTTSATPPIVVFFYGGGWHSGQRADYLFVGEALASRGMIAVLPDYRLFPEVRFPSFLEDCALAYAWVLKHALELGGHPGRVFAMGHSAGAYNAAMLTLDPQWLRAASAGPKPVRGLVGLAGPYDFIPIQDPVARQVFGYPDTPTATQPINFVTKDAPPTLLIHPVEDDIADPGNSVRLEARLRQAGVPVERHPYPRVSHVTLIGSIAAPLRLLSPLLSDVEAFVKGNA